MVLGTLFLLLNGLLVQGEVTATSDGDGYFFPYYVLVADFARAGKLLLWDPWSNGGVPILGDPQVGVFSPLVLLSGLLTGGSSGGFVFYWLMVWLLGGAGVMILARHLRAPLWGGFALALAYLFSGLYTGDAQFVSWVAGFSFLPFVVWRLDVALETRRILPAVQAGAIWGLAALGSYPGFTIVTGLFCALWALGRALTGEARAGDSTDAATVSRGFKVRFAVLAVALVAVVGVVVLAPTYVTFFVEGAGFHRRIDVLDRNLAVGGNRLAPGALSTLLSPYIALIKASNPYTLFVRNAVASCSIYVGAVTAVLAVYALVRRPKSAWRWWVLGAGLLFLAASLGDALPLRGLLYDYFLPFRYFRHSALMRAFFMFSLTILALLGSRDLAETAGELRRRATTRVLVVAAALALITLVVLGGFMFGASDLTKPYTGWAWSHFAVVWVGLCVGAAVASFGPERVRRAAIPVLVVVIAVADAYITSVISSPITFDIDPRSVQRWQALDRGHVSAIDLDAAGLNRTETPCGTNPECKSNRQLVTKVPAFNSFSTEKNDVHQAMVATDPLRLAATGNDRVWFASEAARAASDRASVAALVQRTKELGTPPLVVTPRDAMLDDTAAIDANGAPPISSAPPMVKVPAAVERYTSDALQLEVKAPIDGWLLVTDRWARGWAATVNDEPATIEGGNFLFRAVRVHAGDNVVSFTYHPFGIPTLLVFSWATLAAVLGWTVVATLRRRTSQVVAADPEPAGSEPVPVPEPEPTTGAEGDTASQPVPKPKRKRKRR